MQSKGENEHYQYKRITFECEMKGQKIYELYSLNVNGRNVFRFIVERIANNFYSFQRDINDLLFRNFAQHQYFIIRK